MNTREVIADLIARNLENRLNKLTELGAPRIILDNTSKALADAKAANIKVNGLERKHKEAATAEVTALYQAETTGYYYKDGKQKTLVLKLETEAGTYFYDYRDNKIGRSFTELAVSVADDKFELVWN